MDPHKQTETHADAAVHAHDGHPHAYDTHEPNYMVIGLFTAICVILFIATVGGVYLYYVIVRDKEVYDLVLSPPSQELQALRKQEDEKLHSWGVADKAKGTVRIPIDRAMQMVVQEAKAGSLRYNTAAYSVKSAQQAGAGVPALQTPGASSGPAPSDNRPASQKK